MRGDMVKDMRRRGKRGNERGHGKRHEEER
jgi:hypothetical protein